MLSEWRETVVIDGTWRPATVEERRWLAEHTRLDHEPGRVQHQRRLDGEQRGGYFFNDRRRVR